MRTINADFSMMGLAFKLFYNTEAGKANQHGATLVHDVNTSWAILLNNVLAGSELRQQHYSLNLNRIVFYLQTTS